MRTGPPLYRKFKLLSPTDTLHLATVSSVRMVSPGHDAAIVSKSSKGIRSAPDLTNLSQDVFW